MLEDLFKLVQEHASESVINNSDIPNEKNNEVVAEATKTVAGGLQNMMAGGGLESVLSLFSSGQNQQAGLQANPIVNMMKGHFISKLTGKFNMEGPQASNVANKLIPDVLSKLVQQSNNSGSGGFNINSILGALSGNSNAQSGNGGFDFQNIISSLSAGGLDVNNDGRVGLDDLISKVTGGAQQQVRQQNSTAGGGLMDMIQGLLK